MNNNFEKLKTSLTKTRKGFLGKIVDVFGVKRKVDDEVLEEIEFPHDGFIRAYTYLKHQAVNSGDTIAYITHNT